MSAEADRSTEDLGGRAARGAAVTAIGQACRILVQVGSVVVLARLLSPHDYGLFAMVMTLAGIAEIFRDFGLSSAAIQTPNLSRGQRDNLFWLNSAIGLGLSVLVFLAAPLVAAVYGPPELVGLAHLVSTVFLINGLATQHRASLSRDLRFRALAVIDVVAPALALGVGVLCALAGLGYWSLAFQQIAQAVILLVLLVATARWLPGLPKRDAPTGHLVRFGTNMVASQILGYIGNNADSVLIGLRFGTVPVGLYNRAFQLLMTPLNQLRTPITNVAVPVLSRIQEDQQRFSEFIYRGQVALGYTLVAALGVVISAAGPITVIFLGWQWTSITPILALLAVAAVFQTLAFVGYWVYVSRGLTGVLFRYTFISVGIKITCVLVGSLWGVVGVAAGYAVAPILAWPVSLWWVSRHTPVPVRRLVLGVLRISALTGAAAVVAYLVVRLCAPAGPWAQLGADVGVTITCYALAAAVLRPVRRDLTDVLAMIRMVRRRA
ncbi:lipopolysaccharide biosynthesis protein [Pseudonocardia sp. WMMC193]|uniref:lipopolysaccharide biosynthesis protein n=1 Tax=Pseudonocardia sp. WMMC193 TaxID=2911965 RepID=UPI001F46193A|nr:lipopolysaccharide biosynthesis protein [Pseudonocardia sp. WMMC193]MCF7553843.1 lipopolysaccharide biosynthesis protein [Pseudonocardia sp. WMMC193]